jgi:hypothetical protein
MNHPIPSTPAAQIRPIYMTISTPRGGPRILSMGIQNYRNILSYKIMFIKV